MKKISAEIVADSINQQGDRITTMLLTYPRFIHGEVLTHRVFSKNSASSRAIPFHKMVEMVKTDPFIPIAWQKNHSGMQGTEYLSKTDKYNLVEFITSMTSMLHAMIEGTEEHDKLAKELDEKIEIIEMSLMQYTTMTKTLDEWWLLARDKAVEAASIMYVFGVTKQLCNRLLEPFMWHTVLLTGTEFENFFELRCPQYLYDYEDRPIYFKSKKDWVNYYNESQGYKEGHEEFTKIENLTELEWLEINKGQAEIHMGALAEAMYDAYNESTPKELKEGEWHIPFGDKIDYALDKWNFLPNTIELWGKDMSEYGIKVSTARCARLSYMTFDGEIDYEKDLKLHDTLLKSQHMSPFEHCARAMSEVEYNTFFKGEDLHESSSNFNIRNKGWCNNYRGFIQYRYLIEN